MNHQGINLDQSILQGYQEIPSQKAEPIGPPTASEELRKMQNEINFKEAKDFINNDEINYSHPNTFISPTITTPVGESNPQSLSNQIGLRTEQVRITDFQAENTGLAEANIFAAIGENNANGNMPFFDQNVMLNDLNNNYKDSATNIQSTLPLVNPLSNTSEVVEIGRNPNNFVNLTGFQNIGGNTLTITNSPAIQNSSNIMMSEPLSHNINIDCGPLRMLQEENSVRSAAIDSSPMGVLRSTFNDQTSLTSSLPNNDLGLDQVSNIEGNRLLSGVFATNDRNFPVFHASPAINENNDPLQNVNGKDTSDAVKNRANENMIQTFNIQAEQLKKYQDQLILIESMLKQKIIECEDQRRLIDSLKLENSSKCNDIEELKMKVRSFEQKYLQVQNFVASSIGISMQGKNMSAPDNTISSNLMANVLPEADRNKNMFYAQNQILANANWLNRQEQPNINLNSNGSAPLYGQLMFTPGAAMFNSATQVYSQSQSAVAQNTQNLPANATGSAIKYEPLIDAATELYDASIFIQKNHESIVSNDQSRNPANIGSSAGLSNSRRKRGLGENCVWCPEENHKLFELVEKFRDDWHQISSFFEDKSAEECKVQWNILRAHQVGSLMASTQTPAHLLNGQTIAQASTAAGVRFPAEITEDNLKSTPVESTIPTTQMMQQHDEHSVVRDNLQGATKTLLSAETQLVEANSEHLKRPIKKQKTKGNIQSNFQTRDSGWTTEENCKLNELAETLSKDWHQISKHFEKRTPEECIEQWNLIQPKQGKWSAEEDQTLISTYEALRKEEAENSPSWNSTSQTLFWFRVAGYIVGRSGKQCMARYTETLDPAVKKGKWSPEEDTLLKDGVAHFGRSWVKLAATIPGRTQRQCRTRWVQLTKDSKDSNLVSDAVDINQTLLMKDVVHADSDEESDESAEENVESCEK